MSVKQTIVALIIALVAGVAIGRFTLPAKVVTKVEEKIVEKVVYKEKKTKKNNKEVIIVETIYPDGKREKKTHIVDKGVIRVNVAKNSEKVIEKQKEVVKEYSKNDWFISALAGGSINGFSLTNTNIVYGGSISRRIIGPFYLGGFGLTNKTFGGSLGISF